MNIELTNEERNVILAVIDVATKAAGAQVYREGAGALLQSAFTKLVEAKEPEPEKEE